ncbi:hypothetical protein [Paraconexibacter sp.]|uniref:hypothetical protein n=1 Tax=Paraconexibacter sp. TaxID=2949640 RepID=UPI003561F2C5
MGRKIELGMTWAGLVWVILFFIGMVPLANWIPLPSPSDTAAEVQAMYVDHTNSIRAGLALIFTGTIGYILFSAAIASQCRRIKGAPTALRYAQVGSIGACTLLIIVPIIIWFTAAYRPEVRSAESIQLLNDLGWIMFIVGFVPFVAWVWTVGLAILSDEDADPLFPRWAGYLCMLLGTLQIPPILLVFFQTGPFAWNGLFSWWIPATDFFTFFLVMLVLTLRAIRRTPAAAPEAPQAVPELAGAGAGTGR